MDFNWTTVAVIILGLINGGLGVAWMKQRAPMRQVETDREANLLHERAEEMAGMRERLGAIEAKLEQKESQFDAERTMYRHRISNLGQAFHALLLLLKKGVPVDEAVAEVERLRDEQLGREVAEATMYRAAGLKVPELDPFKTAAMNAADCTVDDTKQAAATAKDARDELRRSESGK